MHIFVFEGYVGLVVLIGMLVLKGYAFANACLWPSSAYTMTGKQTKPLWLALLGTGLVAELLLMQWSLWPVSLAFVIVALVYVLDVRPAVAAVTRRV